MAETTLAIHDATIADAKELHALGRNLYRTYFAHLWTKKGFEHFLDREFDQDQIHADIIQSRASYYLIEMDGETIGFAKTKLQKMPRSDCRGTLLDKVYFI
ncbi:MAG: hypothetical protein ABIN83_05095, partial [Sphingomicrobium sp.]